MSVVAHAEPALASQATFRAVMNAFARPGSIHTAAAAAPEPLSAASAAVLLALADYETPVWLDAAASQPAIADWIRFQSGASVAKAPAEAAFAVIADPLKMPDWTAFALGSEDYPDRSTTIVMQVQDFDGEPISITGPGIKTQCTFAARPLPSDFVRRLAANRELYPRGIDLILTAGGRLLALPRSLIVRGR